MFGSGWPVSTPRAGHSRVVVLTAERLGELSSDRQAKVFGTTAAPGTGSALRTTTARAAMRVNAIGRTSTRVTGLGFGSAPIGTALAGPDETALGAVEAA
jgi:hypothetical protein